MNIVLYGASGRLIVTVRDAGVPRLVVVGRAGSPGVSVLVRLGTDQLIRDAQGKSWISYQDYALALIDELETPAHERMRFTIGYE